MKYILCKDCPFFIPNGGYTSFEVIYNLGKPQKLGICQKTKELKNELCACKIEKENETCKK